MRRCRSPRRRRASRLSARPSGNSRPPKPGNTRLRNGGSRPAPIPMIAPDTRPDRRRRLRTSERGRVAAQPRPEHGQPRLPRRSSSFRDQTSPARWIMRPSSPPRRSTSTAESRAGPNLLPDRTGRGSRIASGGRCPGHDRETRQSAPGLVAAHDRSVRDAAVAASAAAPSPALASAAAALGAARDRARGVPDRRGRPRACRRKPARA